MRNIIKISYKKFTHLTIFLPQYANEPSHLVLWIIHRFLTQYFISWDSFLRNPQIRRRVAALQILFAGFRPVRYFRTKEKSENIWGTVSERTAVRTLGVT